MVASRRCALINGCIRTSNRHVFRCSLLRFPFGMHSLSAFSVSRFHVCLPLLARLLCRALCGCSGVVGRQVASFCFVVPAVYAARLLACLLDSRLLVFPCNATFFCLAPLSGRHSHGSMKTGRICVLKEIRVTYSSHVFRSNCVCRRTFRSQKDE